MHCHSTAFERIAVIAFQYTLYPNPLEPPPFFSNDSRLVSLSKHYAIGSVCCLLNYRALIASVLFELIIIIEQHVVHCKQVSATKLMSRTSRSVKGNLRIRKRLLLMPNDLSTSLRVDSNFFDHIAKNGYAHVLQGAKVCSHLW